LAHLVRLIPVLVGILPTHTGEIDFMIHCRASKTPNARLSSFLAGNQDAPEVVSAKLDASRRIVDDATETRQARIVRIRQEIAAGTYDTPEKMEIALERLLDRLSGE
jgi:hypothetical protein